MTNELFIPQNDESTPETVAESLATANLPADHLGTIGETAVYLPLVQHIAEPVEAPIERVLRILADLNYEVGYLIDRSDPDQKGASSPEELRRLSRAISELGRVQAKLTELRGRK